MVEPPPEATPWLGRQPLAALAITCLVAGTGLTVLADQGWVLALGVVALFVFVASTFLLITLPSGSTGS